MKIIDPHVHLFDLQLGDYAWLKPTNSSNWLDNADICRDFNATDLALGDSRQLAGFIHIEAGFDNKAPWREIEWLEQTVGSTFKSVAAATLTDESADFACKIAKLQAYSSVVGVRHMFDQHACQLLSSEQVRDNLAHLAECGLIFETQLSGTDNLAIKLLVDIATRLPQLTIVLSHANFAPVAGDRMTCWEDNIKALAQCDNIMIKASGWEMVARDFEAQATYLVIRIILQYFGTERVMLASNFPLCLLSIEYQQLWGMYLAMDFSESTLTKISHDNALRIYRLAD